MKRGNKKMKISKKLMAALVALTLCFTMLCSVPAFAGPLDPPVVAEPTQPTEPPTSQDIGEIIGGFLGDVDPTLGDEIRDTAEQTRGILTFFTDLIDKISDIFGALLNILIGNFSKDKLF